MGQSLTPGVKTNPATGVMQTNSNTVGSKAGQMASSRAQGRAMPGAGAPMAQRVVSGQGPGQKGKDYAALAGIPTASTAPTLPAAPTNPMAARVASGQGYGSKGRSYAELVGGLIGGAVAGLGGK